MFARKGNGLGTKLRVFPSHVDEKLVNQMWAGLEKAIQEIQRKTNSLLSFEELYRNAYTLVLQKQGEKLYSNLRRVVKDHLRSHICPVVVESIAGGRFLETLNDKWNDHTIAMVMIRDILMYLDRVYVEKQKVEPIYSVGLILFRDAVIRQNGVNDSLRATLLSLVSEERNGNPVNWIGIKNATQMLVQLGIDSHAVYETEFEQAYLQETAEYCKRQSHKFLAANNACEYILAVERCIEAEQDRARRYLAPLSEAKVLQVLDDVMITKNMDIVVNIEQSGVVHMLKNDNVEDLKRMYRLLKRVTNGLPTMTQAMSRYLREQGELIVADDGDLAKSPVQFIQALLDLKDQFDHFLYDAFNDDKLFKNRIQTDFEYFFNKNQKSAEFLSLYMDDKLKKGVRLIGEVEIEILLDKAMVLFRFVQEKDAFDKYYKQHLAKRLLLDKSISDDAEKQMLTKLKTECGCQFTQKLESMFRDKELWNTAADNFKNFKDTISPAQLIRRDPVDISVRVLTTGIWPMRNASVLCVLPPVCTTSFKNFEEYYVQKHSGRKITLNTLLGNAEVKALFSGAASTADESQEETSSAVSPKKRKVESKILQTTTHAMVILMRFNAKASFTFDELKADTQIPERELKRNLQSLAMGKATQRILCRKGKGKEIDGQDEFCVNDAFTSKLIRIKIQLVTTKHDAEPERNEMKNKIDEDRRHEIDASIVRIMKSRKQLSHNHLITEVIQQLKHRFLPSPMLIKKRIESLMEREYLARDANDHKNYIYVT